MSGWPRITLREAINRIVGGKNVEAGRGLSPYRILKVSAVTSGYFRPDEAKPAPDDHRPLPEHHIRKGDFLFTRANTSALVGAVAIVNEDHSGLLLPDKIWRIEWRRELIEPRFAYFLLRSTGVRRVTALVVNGSKGTLTDKAVFNIANECRELGINTEPNDRAFVERQAEEARAIALDGLPADPAS